MESTVRLLNHWCSIYLRPWQPSNSWSKTESNGEVIGKGKIDYMIDLMRKEKKIMQRFRRRRYFLYSCPPSNEMQISHFRCFLRRQCKLLHSKTTPQSLRLLPITIDTQYTCVPGSPLTANVKLKATVRLLERENWWYDWPYDIKKKVNNNNATSPKETRLFVQWSSKQWKAIISFPMFS